MSATFCLATGTYSNSPTSGDQGTVVERWNGSSWSVVASPNPGNNGDVLDGMSCTSMTSCVAVGSYANGSSYADTLVDKWNGRSLAVVASPNPTGARFGSYLNSVSCVSATFCMAAGEVSYAADHDNTLVEEWNGRSWAVVSSPSPDNSNDLLGISCTSATFCVAAGSYETVSGSQGTLVEKWNGKSWTVVSSPNPGSSTELLSISCMSATFCLATGTYTNSPALVDQGTVVERWNGSSWSIVSSPNPGNNGDTLDGMSCTSTTSCVAVGSYANGSSHADTLVEKWTGRSWAVVSSPNPKAAGYGSYLNSVSCASTTFCMAAGAYSYAANHDNTLVEKSG